jgi:hypothetical protein
MTHRARESPESLFSILVINYMHSDTVRHSAYRFDETICSTFDIGFCIFRAQINNLTTGMRVDYKPGTN